MLLPCCDVRLEEDKIDSACSFKLYKFILSLIFNKKLTFLPSTTVEYWPHASSRNPTLARWEVHCRSIHPYYLAVCLPVSQPLPPPIQSKIYKERNREEARFTQKIVLSGTRTGECPLDDDCFWRTHIKNY